MCVYICNLRMRIVHTNKFLIHNKICCAKTNPKEEDRPKLNWNLKCSQRKKCNPSTHSPHMQTHSVQLLKVKFGNSHQQKKTKQRDFRISVTSEHRLKDLLAILCLKMISLRESILVMRSCP